MKCVEFKNKLVGEMEREFGKFSVYFRIHVRDNLYLPYLNLDNSIFSIIANRDY